MQRILLDRPKLPRNREIRACLPCRNGKLKCDQLKPRCQRCVTNNRSCIYVSRARKIAEERHGHGVSESATDKTDPPHGDQTIWPNQVGHLTASDDAQLQYYNSASWLSALDNSESPTDSGSDSQESPNTSPSIQFTGSEQLTECLTEQLYSFSHPGEVSRLVCFFAEFCHFFYPVVDIPEIVGSLRFLQSQKRSPAGSSALIAAMCYGATASLCSANDVEAASLDPVAWRELSHRLLVESGYPLRLTMSNLRAAFLLAASSMAEWGTHRDPAPICVLVRAAQSFGLHRDPESFRFSPREANLRRILWWAIYALDMGYATAHALPPLTHASDSDVKATLEGDESEVAMLSTLIRINQMFARVFDGIYGIRKPTQDMFQTLSDDAASMCAEVVSNSHRRQSQYRGPNPPPGHGHGHGHGHGPRRAFIAASERMCADKVMLIVHQPYLRSKQWPRSSRGKALAACRNYILDFADTVTEPSLAPFRWILNHWNMFHACAIVLQDLTQYPFSAESEGLLDLIDSTFSRFRRDDDVNWKRLEPLRVKAFSANGRGPPLVGDSRGGAYGEGESAAMEMPLDAGNASLSDWDPLFASFIWDDPPPTLSG